MSCNGRLQLTALSSARHHHGAGEKRPPPRMVTDVATISEANSTEDSGSEQEENATTTTNNNAAPAATTTSTRSLDSAMNPRVTLNIGGQRFITYASTLSRHPGTLLSALSKGNPAYDSQSGGIFLWQESAALPLRSGPLPLRRAALPAQPVWTAGQERRLEFWGISEGKVAACCWRTFKEFEEEKRTLEELEEAFHGHRRMFQVLAGRRGPGVTSVVVNGWIRWKMQVLQFLEDPSSSRPAKVWRMYSYILQRKRPRHKAYMTCTPLSQPVLLSGTYIYIYIYIYNIYIYISV